MPAGDDPSDDRPHSRLVQSDGGGHRPAELQRPEPAKHSHPHTGEPRNPLRVSAGEDGWSLLACDYSQIELRVLAHFSGDEALARVVRQERRHSRPRGQPGLRRAARPGDEPAAPRGQGGELRRDLRPESVRPVEDDRQSRRTRRPGSSTPTSPATGREQVSAARFSGNASRRVTSRRFAAAAARSTACAIPAGPRAPWPTASAARATWPSGPRSTP